MGGLRAEGWLETLVARAGEGPALVFGRHERSAAEVARDAREMLEGLTGSGVESGDVLAVLAPPSLEGVALVHAVFDRGIVLLPLNARLAEPEQRLALRVSGARFLVVPAAADQSLALRLSREVGCGLLAFGAFGEGAVMTQLRAPAAEHSRAFSERRTRRLAESAALVIRTSGTSGQPKGAVLGLDNLRASAAASAGLLGSRSSDRWLVCMPLFHIGGLSILVRAAWGGAGVFLQDRFDPVAVARAFEEQSITHVSLVATMLERLLATRGERRAPSSLELMLLGGGPASTSLISRAEALGYPVAPTYGLTEAASQVATRPPRDRGLGGPREKEAGLEVLPGLELRVVDDRGRALGLESEGQIQLRGPTVMRGYLDDPSATREALSEGWLSTGDMGRLDREGRLCVLDRRSDLVVSGGENVYPAEVERVLEEHPDVAEAGVCGVADARFGSRPVARVVVRPGRPFEREELLAFCRGRLAAYKCPVEIERLETLPRNSLGKLLRRRLLE